LKAAVDEKIKMQTDRLRELAQKAIAAEESKSKKKTTAGASKALNRFEIFMKNADIVNDKIKTAREKKKTGCQEVASHFMERFSNSFATWVFFLCMVS
jgi:hypothetical protein